MEKRGGGPGEEEREREEERREGSKRREVGRHAEGRGEEGKGGERRRDRQREDGRLGSEEGEQRVRKEREREKEEDALGERDGKGERIRQRDTEREGEKERERDRSRERGSRAQVSTSERQNDRDFPLPPPPPGAPTADPPPRTRGHAESAEPVPASLEAMEAAQKALEEQETAKEAAALKKQEPNFGLSGKLAEETNRVRGVTLLFSEPPEARKPTTRWRFYVFKDGEPMKEPLYIHRQSCYLFGRERKVVDIPTDHPSCSKQHAVLQYRLVEKEVVFEFKSTVKPYLMDLGSTNGTFLNGIRLESQRYYEMLEKDTIKFGNSSREYVLLHENSA